MNKVILMGRITAEPTLRTTPANKKVVNFTIAVQRRFAQEGQQQADFVYCVAWEKTAEFICRYFSKGSLIAVDGEIQTRSWEAEGGKRQYVTEVRVDNAYFTGERKEQCDTVYSPESDAADFEVIADESDLPF